MTKNSNFSVLLKKHTNTLSQNLQTKTPILRPSLPVAVGRERLWGHRHKELSLAQRSEFVLRNENIILNCMIIHNVKNIMNIKHLLQKKIIRVLKFILWMKFILQLKLYCI